MPAACLGHRVDQAAKRRGAREREPVPRAKCADGTQAGGVPSAAATSGARRPAQLTTVRQSMRTGSTPPTSSRSPRPSPRPEHGAVADQRAAGVLQVTSRLVSSAWLSTMPVEWRQYRGHRLDLGLELAPLGAL